MTAPRIGGRPVLAASGGGVGGEWGGDAWVMLSHPGCSGIGNVPLGGLSGGHAGPRLGGGCWASSGGPCGASKLIFDPDGLVWPHLGGTWAWEGFVPRRDLTK